MSKIPEISTGPVADMQSAVKEYKYLQGLLEKKTGFPQGGSGWSISFTNKINDRQNYLRQAITNFACKKES